MSDTYLAQVIQYGTAAARVAYTPNPSGPLPVLYLWYETDNAPDLYAWDGSAWNLVNATGGSGITELTGEVTAGPGSGSQAATIANTAVTPGSYTNTDLTVGADGRITAAANGSAGVTSVVVQVVNTQTGAVATGTTIIPIDDTIPQNTEGTEFMTLAITPTNAAHQLIIDVVCHLVSSAANAWSIVALFQDTTAGALNTGAGFSPTGGAGTPIVLRHVMTAGTTSSTTFKVRGGPHTASTVSFNGNAGNRLFGGVYYSSITITEIIP